MARRVAPAADGGEPVAHSWSRLGFGVAVGVAATALMVGLGAWSHFESRNIARAPAPVGADLPDSLRTGKPTVAEFGANACASCREMKTILGELKRTHGGRYAVVEIDIVRQREFIAPHRIQLMPTQIFFDAQGRETGRHLGKLELDGIVRRLEETSGRP